MLRELNSSTRAVSENAGPLQQQLSRYVSLSAEEAAVVEALALHGCSVHADKILIHAGERQDHAFLILEGYAYRYKLLEDGHRQILAYLLPGDLSNIEFADYTRSDHSVATLTEAVVARIALSQIAAIQERYPNIRRAFSLTVAAERSLLRHWLLSVGQRTTVQRISHFLCEISSKLRAHGQLEAGATIRLPFSQAVLADTTGVTTVHINRVLQQLRRDGLVEMRRHEVTIVDPVRLAQLADFDEDYLFNERHFR